MNMLPKTKTGSQGFTLLEVIAVLIIIGIITTVAISRFVNYDAEVYAGADVLKSHLRYAQTLAMNSNPNAGTATLWGIGGAANSYWLFQGTNSTNYMRLPEEETFINPDRTINLTAKKIKLTGIFTIYFDNCGIPYTAYTDATTNTPLTSALTINVQPRNANSPNIAVTITPLTGYIP